MSSKLPLRVLVVDDDDSLAKALSATLNRRGFDAKAIYGDRDRLLDDLRAAIRERTYDVAVVDVVIPQCSQSVEGKDKPVGVIDRDAGRGGLKVLMNIMTYSPSTNVIVFSERATTEEVLECIRWGASDFLPKPVGGDTWYLEDKIRACASGLGIRQEMVGLREFHIRSLWFNVSEGRPAERGQRLEQLVYHIFASISGFGELRLNVRRGGDEIDLEFLNQRTEPFWIGRGGRVIVECKNLETGRKAPRKHLDEFLGKMERTGAGCKLGFFVSYSGFSHYFPEVLHSQPRDDSVVVLVDHRVLEELVRADYRHRPAILEKIVSKAMAGGT